MSGADFVFSSISTALTGLTSATERVGIAARNIVNTNTASTPAPSGQVAGDAFQPARAVQTPLPSGGVKTTAEPVRPSHTRQYVPSSPLADADGFVDFPNISLVDQIVELKQASIAYEANARVVEEEDERLGTLLDRLK